MVHNNTNHGERKILIGVYHRHILLDVACPFKASLRSGTANC